MTDSAPTDPVPTARRRRLIPIVATAGVLAVATGAFALYGIAPRGRKKVAAGGVCALSQMAAGRADPLVRGEVAALALADGDNRLSDIAFTGPDGAKTTIGDFKGRTVLLNLWATWCVPCRQEMPSLAKLQAVQGSAGFSVVAVNIDTVRLDKPKAFLKEIGATSLPFYADHTADILQQLKRSQQIPGLPTSILIGKDGCEIGTLAGAAEWDSPDAQALIRQVQS